MPGERKNLVNAYVERLEAALAEAAHARDLAEERARLASEGVEQLERRAERLRVDIERERGEAERELERHAAEAEERRERELGEVRERLAAREEHLDNARTGIESRDRRLEVAKEQLDARDAELAAGRAELDELNEALAAQRSEAAVAKAQLQLREEELERSRETTREARGELEARTHELKQAGEELVAREREFDAASTLLEAQGAELARAREAGRETARERDEVRERLDESKASHEETAARLEAREKQLANAKAGIESRERRLAAAERAAEASAGDLSEREAEIGRLRAAARDSDRRLVLAEGRLEKARQRAEYFQSSLVELREGKAYRLMRILWRLRRPFRRAPRPSATDDGAADDAESGPVPASSGQLPRQLATSSRYAREKRQPGESPRVASILDEMSEACFAPECELMPLTLEGWAAQLDERPPDLLLVESAWNGNGGEWQYRIAQYPRQDLVGLPALRALIDGCRERGIPTAFWNKEDPVHFERFAEAAALFDHVFTTDARCVERYRALPGGERTVTPLPFAAQPRVHNPVAVVPARSSSPCFAGAWYRDRHPDRRRALAALLDAARPRGLVIYDRSFGGEDGAFGFPERFAPHVLGGLPYERILDVYKSHRVFLNANSVVDSPTMCSRRVFELAASDTPILSTPGVALTALLGDGLVEEAADEGAAAAALARLLEDEPERRRRTRAARRKVFAEHTYADRLATIVATAGLAAPDRNGQGWELIVQPGIALSEDARADLEAAALFADADAIGVHPGNGAAPIEHRRVDELDPRALLVRRELIERRGRLAADPERLSAQLRRWSDDGVRLYAADADLLVPDGREAVVR